MTFLEFSSRILPIQCRILARKGRHWLTNQEIADASGLSLSKVRKISISTSWKNITIGDASSFADACGVGLARPRRALDYLKRRKFTHTKWRPAYLGYLLKIASKAQLNSD